MIATKEVESDRMREVEGGKRRGERRLFRICGWVSREIDSDRWMENLFETFAFRIRSVFIYLFESLFLLLITNFTIMNL